MADYTDALVVYDSGSLKKMAANETIEIHGLTLPDSGLTLNATAVTSTAAELNLIDGSSAGTIVNSKAVIYGSSGEVNATTLQIAGTSITATAAEINVLDGASSANNTTGLAAILGTNGNLTIAGDLTVNGTTTTVNSTTVQIDDLNLQLADGAAAASAVNGGGITLAHTGDNFTWQYNHASTAWKSSIDVDLASGKVYKINGTSVLSADTLGGGVTASSLTSVGTLTGLTVNGDVTVSDGANDLNIASHDGTNGLQLGGTLVTASASELNILDGASVTSTELNLLDGDTAVGSSITIVDADGLVINDGGTMKTIPASDLKSYINASAAGSIAADDIIAGDDAVEITTTSGDVVVDAPTGQSVDLQVNGGNVVEVAATRVDMSQTLILADTSAGGGLELSVSGTYGSAIAVGDIVGLGTGATGGLELADADGSVSDPIGVALGASSASTADDIMVHTLFGARVQVTANSSITPGKGEFLYLDTNAGKVTATAPSSGKVWRLGITAVDYSAGASSLNIIWMPQFIADLG